MKITRNQLRKLINVVVINEGYGFFSSEDKNDVFGASPDQAKQHAEKHGKAYYVYKSQKDGNVYVDLYDKESSEFPDYIETDKSEKDVNQEDVKKFYQGN